MVGMQKSQMLIPSAVQRDMKKTAWNQIDDALTETTNTAYTTHQTEMDNIYQISQ